jgi:hypothetical protein
VTTAGFLFTKMNFEKYLHTLLKDKKIDTTVYHSYLLGILEDTIEDDEKREMILDIISSLIVSYLGPYLVE